MALFAMLIASLTGCTGKSEVKTQGGADDKPFRVYQDGIDRAKDAQGKTDQRTTVQDSAAAAAGDPGQ
jgi:hypothetical protein